MLCTKMVLTFNYLQLVQSHFSKRVSEIDKLTLTQALQMCFLPGLCSANMRETLCVLEGLVEWCIYGSLYFKEIIVICINVQTGI